MTVRVIEMKRAFPILSFAIFAVIVTAVFIAKVFRDDRAAQEALTAEPSVTGKRGRVIAKIHSTGEMNGVIYVYAVDKRHRFPNGTITEGWLVEPDHLVGHGDPIWVMPPKGQVEWVAGPIGQ
jgi:hypothetical protein